MKQFTPWLLATFMVSLAACRHLPNPDVPPAQDYPEHTPSPKAQALLVQARQAESRDKGAALSLYRQYVQSCPWDLQVREVIAGDEFDLHHSQAALDEYLALLKYVRSHDIPQWDFNILNQTAVENGIGHCYLELHQPEKALEYYRRVGEYGESFYTHYNLARAYLQLKDYCSASYHFKLIKDAGAHEDMIKEIESQIPNDPCRRRK
jgi:tetratricopeptide (TPR) repeat protein